MNHWSVLFPMLKADFLERTRRNSFLIGLCLVVYLGYAVNTGQILILLGAYRGIYNSAWVGSLMAVVITFFLGIFGFYLVKDTIQRDECSGVGQIIATTSLSRAQYLLGKWLSNLAVLSALVGVLALAAILMQMIQPEGGQIQIWALIAPLIFIALPMMALVAAFAVFFESVPWLKGGFGNLVYFFLFTFLLVVGVYLKQMPWLDVIGINLVGSSMKAAAKAAYPAYGGEFVLAMISNKPLQTFIWFGINWTGGLMLQRLAWLVVSAGVTLLGVLFFDRFDPSSRSIAKKKPKSDLPEPAVLDEAAGPWPGDLKMERLMPLVRNQHFNFNFLSLVWLECKLLLKGLKWYWLVGMTVLWIGCIADPFGGRRPFWFMLISIWPVLLWSSMGEREARWQTEQLLYHAPHSLLRLLGSSWLAGVLITALAASGVLLGRLIHAEPVALLSWVLSVVFIPTLALTLGTWSRSSKLFEVVYPILWYLGPLNPQNQLAVLDYLGIHAGAPVNICPLWFTGFIVALGLLALAGRRRQIPI